MPLELNTPRKSSYSNPSGNCLEATWKKSSYSQNGGSCVEVTRDEDSSKEGSEYVIRVRDTKLGADSPVLIFTPDEWEAFIKGAQAGEFDLADGTSAGGYSVTTAVPLPA